MKQAFLGALALLVASHAHAQSLPCGTSLAVTIALPGAPATSYAVPLTACTPTLAPTTVIAAAPLVTAPPPPAVSHATVLAYDVDLDGRLGRVLQPMDGANLHFNGIVIVRHHGSGETRLSFEQDTTSASVRTALLDAGYLIASSDGSGTSDWGNQATIEAHAALAGYLDARYRPRGIVIWSSSMGGLSGLTSIIQGRVPKLKGWIGQYPVTGLRAIFDAFSPENKPLIRWAYGMPGDGSGDGQWNARTSGHDPMLANPAIFTGLPMIFFASPADTVVSMTAHSLAFMSRVAPYARTTLVSCTGDHGDGSHMQPDALLTFLGAL